MGLRIYVSGQRAFGAAVADLVISSGHTLVGVASPEFAGAAPVSPADLDRAEYRADLLHVAAVRYNVPWTDATYLRARHIPDGTDLIVAAHSHAFIGAHTRARARMAAIGYHPSLLPMHRGRDAIRWTIRDGDRVTGGSVYHLTNAIDGGPLAAQDYLFVPPGSTAKSLWKEHLFPLGIRLLGKVFADMSAGRVVCVPQDESAATWEPSWERPRLHRPELPAIAAADSTFHYDADPAAMRA